MRAWVFLSLVVGLLTQGCEAPQGGLGEPLPEQPPRPEDPGPAGPIDPADPIDPEGASFELQVISAELDVPPVGFQTPTESVAVNQRLRLDPVFHGDRFVVRLSTPWRDFMEYDTRFSGDRLYLEPPPTAFVQYPIFDGLFLGRPAQAIIHSISLRARLEGERLIIDDQPDARFVGEEHIERADGNTFGMQLSGQMLVQADTTTPLARFERDAYGEARPALLPWESVKLCFSEPVTVEQIAPLLVSNSDFLVEERNVELVRCIFVHPATRWPAGEALRLTLSGGVVDLQRNANAGAVAVFETVPVLTPRAEINFEDGLESVFSWTPAVEVPRNIDCDEGNGCLAFSLRPGTTSGFYAHLRSEAPFEEVRVRLRTLRMPSDDGLVAAPMRFFVAKDLSRERVTVGSGLIDRIEPNPNAPAPFGFDSGWVERSFSVTSGPAEQAGFVMEFEPNDAQTWLLLVDSISVF